MLKALKVWDFVRVGQRWMQVRGFQIIDGRKWAVLVGSVGQLTVPISRIRYLDGRFTLEKKTPDSPSAEQEQKELAFN